MVISMIEVHVEPRKFFAELLEDYKPHLETASQCPIFIVAKLMDLVYLWDILLEMGLMW